MDAFVNGIRLFYEQTGEGRPLVFLHGNGEDHTIFEEAVEVLFPQFACYCLTFRVLIYSNRTRFGIIQWERKGEVCLFHLTQD